MKSGDEVVAKSAVVLLGLKASLLASDDFWEAYVDACAVVISNQQKILIDLMNQADK